MNIYIYIYTILYKNSQVSKSQQLPLRKLSRKQLAQGLLLTQGTCARNSRKLTRKQLAQANLPYVCMSECTFASVYVYTYVRIYVYMHIHISSRELAQDSRKARASKSCVCVFVRTSASRQVCTYVHMYKCTYVHTYVHTYIRTYQHLYIYKLA